MRSAHIAYLGSFCEAILRCRIASYHNAERTVRMRNIPQ